MKKIIKYILLISIMVLISIASSVITYNILVPKEKELGIFDLAEKAASIVKGSALDEDLTPDATDEVITISGGNNYRAQIGNLPAPTPASGDFTNIKEVYYVSNDAGISDHGDTGESGSLADVIVNEVAGDYANVEMPGNKSYDVSTNLTIPATAQYVPQWGAVLKPANGVTITFSGGPENISADMRQKLFDLSAGGTIDFGHGGRVSVMWFGATGDGSTDDEAAIEACNASINTTASGGHIIFPETGHDYIISGSIQFGGSTTIEFIGNSSYAKCTSNELGGFFMSAVDANLIYINPRIDGNNIVGINGIGSNAGTTIDIRGGHLKNYVVAGDYTGGKAINCDGYGAEVFINGTMITASHIAIAMKRDKVSDSSDDALQAEISNVYGYDCDLFFLGSIVNSQNNDGTLYAVSISNFNTLDCGSLGGIFMFNRASNVKINNGSISATSGYNSSTPINSIFRGRGRKLTINNIVINQDADAVINIDPDTNYAWAEAECADNYYKINASGDYDYVYLSDLGATKPYRYLNNSYIEVLLKNDVGTAIVSPETRNGDTFMKIIQDDKLLIAKANDINLNYTTMADVESGTTIATDTNIADRLISTVPVTFGATDHTPTVARGNRFFTGSTYRIDDFDDGVAGQYIRVHIKHAMTFDFDSPQDADHNLDGRAQDLIANNGDVVDFYCEDGTTWWLVNFNDASEGSDGTTFGATDHTPTVLNGDLFYTGGTYSITDFDDGVTGQDIMVLVKHAVTFDFTSPQDADHNLDGSSANITGNSGDVIQFHCEDGITWWLTNYNDASKDANGGHSGT